jgi:hypothetical protein
MVKPARAEWKATRFTQEVFMMAIVPVHRCGLVLIGLAAFSAVTTASDPKPPKMRFAADTRTAAERWQVESRKTVFDLLKLTDLQATRNPGGEALPFAAKVLRDEDRSKYTWSQLELNSTPARRIKVLLTIPKNGKPGEKFPAVVCIHGHGGDRYIVYDRKSIYHGFATELAERGFVTISTDVGQHEIYEKDRTLMGERLWDVLRCADYVAGLPEVEAKRLGCAGLSLGGEMAMWLGAMDPRMRATVSSGFLTTVANMRTGHCPCWDFPGLTDNFDFSDIYSLTAPRALLCQIGRKERAPGGFPLDIAERALTEIRKAYTVFGAENDAQLDVHPEGHEFIVSPALTFLERNMR